MATALDLTYDAGLVDEIGDAFALRTHNRQALHALVKTMAEGYDPNTELLLDLSTGAGKTYIMTAFGEYLRRNGHYTLLVVTPGDIVHSKTVANFTEGNDKYVAGAAITPNVFHPGNYTGWAQAQEGTGYNALNRPLNVIVLNVHQLLPPTEKDLTKGASKDSKAAKTLTIRKFNEDFGNIYETLATMDDLVVIVDESHIISETAAKYTNAIWDLHAAAVIGLSATSQSVSKAREPRTVFTYRLHQAIKDKHVKAPVLALRRGGYPDDETKEDLQLKDALTLRNRKVDAYAAWAIDQGLDHYTAPKLLVVCEDTTHAKQVAARLAAPDLLGSVDKVLHIDTKTKEDKGVIERLATIDRPDSPIEAVVSVNMLREGWDSKSIAVVCALRTMGSQVLTQQTMGRGLRLPFGKYTTVDTINELDIISHDSFEKALKDENVLKSFGLDEAVDPGKKPVIKPVVPPVKPGPTPAPNTNPGGTTGGNTTDPGHPSLFDPHTKNDDPTTPPVDTTDPTKPEVGIRGFDEDPDDKFDTPPQPQVFNVNEKFKDLTFFFPTSVKKPGAPTPFSPATISNDILKQAAAAVADSGERIERRVIKANPRLRRLSAQATVDETVDAMPMTVGDARALIWDNARADQGTGLRSVTPDHQLAKIALGRLDYFMDAVTTAWTVSSAMSAAEIFIKLYKDAYRAHARQIPPAILEIHAAAVPVYTEITVPSDDYVHDRGDTFIEKQYFGEYRQALFPIAKFDAENTEYVLAEMMETSNTVTWWKRLDDTRDKQANFAVTAMNNYYPDFVVFEGDITTGHGDYYVVEGKRSDYKNSPDVQAKRNAALEALAASSGYDEFDGQRWHYILVDEIDLKHAQTWEGVKKHAD